MTGPGGWPSRAALTDGVVAGALAGLVSGLPSTLHALATGRPLLEATRAAGRLGAPRSDTDFVLLPAAALVHATLSLGWGMALGAVLPARRTVAWGTAAGLAIAALDLGSVGRRVPAVRSLEPLPQVADHLAFGAVVGAVVRRRRRARVGGTAGGPGSPPRRAPSSSAAAPHG